MKQHQRIRMIVRLSSLVLALFFAVNVVRDVLAGNVHPLSLPFATALVAAFIACLAAWRWERAGGLAVVVCGLAVGLTASLTIAAAGAYVGRDLTPQAVAGLVWALPFVLFGVAFRALAAADTRAAYGSR